MTNPIQHVVIILKENHTFDNYFGTFPGANGVTLPQAPDPQRTDPPHSHAAFLAKSGLKLQYKMANIATYWALAQQYALCDNYFTDVASQSEPNHLHTFAASSPVIDNSSANRAYQPQPPYDIQSLPAVLQGAGHTWRAYADTNSSYFSHVKALAGSPSIVPSAQFLTDVAKGFLPTVSWLYAGSGFSEHPGTSKPGIAAGMKWTSDRVQAIAKSPLWPNTAIFITWDDWGGWYDHVAPPLAQHWSGGGPTGYANSQFRYGNRVPCLAVSPYARQAINHDFFSHASLVKFCLRLFGLAPWNVPALAPADPSGDLFSCFDFTAPPRLGVPKLKPMVSVAAPGAKLAAPKRAVKAASAKKAAAKKPAAAKPVVKRAAAGRKATVKTGTGKVAAKKSAGRKPAVKKAAVKKVAVKKKVALKKSAARTATTKKAVPVRKAPARRRG